MHIDAKPVDFTLSTPFRISRGVQHTSPNAIIQVTHNDYTGYGEASPSEYYGESQETVLACIALFAGNLGNDPFEIEELHQRLDKVIRLHPSAKAAVDMAVYDIMGKMLGVPVYKLLGVTAKRTPHTSFTIGLDTPAQMAKKALLAKNYPILKIKVGTRHDLDIIKAIRDVTSAVLRHSYWDRSPIHLATLSQRQDSRLRQTIVAASSAHTHRYRQSSRQCRDHSSTVSFLWRQ